MSNEKGNNDAVNISSFFNDFIGARKLKYLIKYFRQIQWVGIRNRSVFPKLNYLLDNFEHQGPMSLLLDEQ